MKKTLICILTILALLITGCGQQEAPGAETEPDREIDICLTDCYGVISVLEEDMDGNQVPGEYGPISVLGASGEPIRNGFASSGYSEITPVLEGDSFEGWMECRYDDELGNYIVVSETLYSTGELMSMPVPESPVEYVAKWAGIPLEEYFVSDPFEGTSSSGVFSLSGNGGSLRFLSYSNEEYICTSYTYALEDGQTLNDVMGTEYGDSLMGLTGDGAECTGWTVYMAEDLFFSTEPGEEEDMLCLVYDENEYDGVWYVMLRNPVLVDGNMSTEQLCGMTCHGENYLALANWSE